MWGSMPAMNSWTETLVYALVTAIAAGVGAWVGGGLTLKTQKKLAEEDRQAQTTFAADQRVLDRQEQRAGISRNAAADLLETVATLWRAVPDLSMLREEGSLAHQTATPLGIRREKVREVLDSYRHDMRTTLLVLADDELAGRCRALGVLASELAYGGIEPNSAIMNRALGDIENYSKFVSISLSQLLEGKSLPQHTDPPNLRRPMGDGEAWQPTVLPDKWDQI